jgi:hypothetical protein
MNISTRRSATVIHTFRTSITGTNIKRSKKVDWHFQRAYVYSNIHIFEPPQ